MEKIGRNTGNTNGKLQKEYILYNRDGADLSLIRIENTDKYILKVNPEHEYILEHVGVSIDKDGNYTSYDPSGGPFLYIGGIIGNAIISKIYNDSGTTIFKLLHNNIENYLICNGFELSKGLDDFYSMMQPKIENFVAYEKIVNNYEILAVRGIGTLSKDHWVITVNKSDVTLGKVEILNVNSLLIFFNIWSIEEINLKSELKDFYNYDDSYVN